MDRRDAALALAYAASDAYANEAENTAVIDAVLVHLGERAGVDEHVFAGLVQRFREVLTTNRTAPGVMKMMALADQARVARQQAHVARHRRERRAWAKHAEQSGSELTKLVAATLDALAAEPY
jgi:hypothetical protein